VSKAAATPVVAMGSARPSELVAAASRDHPGVGVRLVIDAFGRSFGRHLHPLAAVVCDAAARVAPLRPNVTTVARALSCSARTLEREFMARELPPPHRLVVLARWLAVAHGWLPFRAQTRMMAREFGFTSTQAFCRATWREIRMSSRELRTDAGVNRLVQEVLTAYGKPASLTYVATWQRFDANWLLRSGRSVRTVPGAHSAAACESWPTADKAVTPSPPN
jgi:AraC-like DNA-binding protein